MGASAAPGRPKQDTSPSGGSAVHAVTSMGAAAAPGRPKQGTAPSGGSEVHAVTSVGVIHLNLSDFWNDFCRLNMPLR